MWRGSKPERDLGWLHGLVHDRQQLAGEGVEVDLLAEAGGERLDGLGGVVLAAVEAAINHLLDPAAGRLKQGRHRQSGAGHRPARGFGADRARELANAQDQAGIDGGEQAVSSP